MAATKIKIPDGCTNSQVLFFHNIGGGEKKIELDEIKCDWTGGTDRLMAVWDERAYQWRVMDVLQLFDNIQRTKSMELTLVEQIYKIEQAGEMIAKLKEKLEVLEGIQDNMNAYTHLDEHIEDMLKVERRLAKLEMPSTPTNILIETPVTTPTPISTPLAPSKLPKPKAAKPPSTKQPAFNVNMP